MGVTGLWKLIDQSGKPVPLDTLENKILAVDISIWLHQVVKGFQDSNGATLPHAHLLGLFHRLCKLMYYRIRPVFVFDGGVPPLKRETIAKRARNKNKYQTEADKLQHLLLEALAKEKVVQQALGASTSALLNNSPKKAIKSAENEEENDLFKLPPMQEDLPKDDSLTDITESDESFDEKQRGIYNHNLQAIDVKSSHFLSLPADIRHEILTDIKETRKQSSWGRLHELPVESQSFSSFQMKRLLKRRQVQVELEEAEKEMGGKGLSMAELENLLSEEGVVDPDIATERIASNEHVRFLHVRDITKALKKETDEKIKKENLGEIKEEEEEENEEVKKLESKKLIKNERLIEEDIDLQRAIQLSLGNADPADLHDPENECDKIRLTVEQKKALGLTANSLARHYMVEYCGLNDDEVSDLVKLDESANVTQEFKFNDDSILIGSVNTNAPSTSVSAPIAEFKGKEISQKLNVERDKTINMSKSSSDADEVSSNADSDFVDVPEIDSEMDNDESFFMRSKFPLPPPFLMNQPPATQNDSSDTKIEVVIDPGQMCSINDDIFADIFSKPDQQNDNKIKEPVTEIIEDDQEVECDNEEIEVTEIKSNKDKEKVDLTEPEIRSKSPEAIVTENTISTKPLPSSKIQNILNELDNEKTAIAKLSLDDLLGTKSSDEKTVANEIEKNLLDILGKKPTEIELTEPTTPTKVPQPFFVKKTPPSSKKKSPNKPEQDNELTPSKASKSLSEAFDSIEATSTKTISEKESLEMAANVLRDKKSKEELEDIAELLHQERRDLVAERNKKDRLGVSITEQMSMECMELLRLFGVPYIVAPMEAEAQCAYLNEINLTDGTITDDSDIWLFGGQTVYKNFFDQNKHVLEFKSENIQRLFHLDRHKLIQLSFLVGSDYTEGIHGIGAVTALEVLSIFTATPEKEGETTQIMSILSSLRKFREWWSNKSIAQRANALRSKLKNITISDDFPNIRVVEAYLFPTVDENREQFTWGKLEVESIREYAKKTFGWTFKRTDEIILPVAKRLNERTSQQSIQNYFKVTGVTSRKDLQVSKRVRAALQQMSGDPDSYLMVDETVEKKKKITKKRATKKSKESTSTDAEKQEDEVFIQPDSTTTSNPEEFVAPKSVAKPVKTSKQTEKPKRKRKAAKEAENISDGEACTSTSLAPKKIVLPDNNAPIPQREMDKQIMESNRLKAIEVLKKTKTKKKT